MLFSRHHFLPIDRDFNGVQRGDIDVRGNLEHRAHRDPLIRWRDPPDIQKTSILEKTQLDRSTASAVTDDRDTHVDHRRRHREMAGGQVHDLEVVARLSRTDADRVHQCDVTRGHQRHLVLTRVAPVREHDDTGHRSPPIPVRDRRDRSGEIGPWCVWLDADQVGCRHVVAERKQFDLKLRGEPG